MLTDCQRCSLLQAYVDFTGRLVCAIVRARRVPRDIKSMPSKILKSLAEDSVAAAVDSDEEGDCSSSATGDIAAGLKLMSTGSGAANQTAKSLPSAETGLSVFEFFSGIG